MSWSWSIGLRSCRNDPPDDDPDHAEYLSIMTALGHLPPDTETDPDRIEERYREKEVIKRRLLRSWTDMRGAGTC